MKYNKPDGYFYLITAMFAIVLLALLYADPCSASSRGEDGKIRHEGMNVHADFVRVVDGDTFVVNFAGRGCPDILCEDVPIRIRGIDTPEIHGAKCDEERKLADSAKVYLGSILKRSDNKAIRLENMTRDKYFRIDATVYAGKFDVGKAMVEQGYAVYYNGQGQRMNWCEKPPAWLPK